MTAKPVMSIASAKTMLNVINTNLSTSATMIINSGSQPAETTTSDSGTNLANPVPDSTTVFGSATNSTSNGLATITANAIASDTNAANTGTAGYFRMKSSGGTTIIQGNVGTSSTDLTLNTTSINAGDTVAITSFLCTLPCGDGAS